MPTLKPVVSKPKRYCSQSTPALCRSCCTAARLIATTATDASSRRCYYICCFTVAATAAVASPSRYYCGFVWLLLLLQRLWRPIVVTANLAAPFPLRLAVFGLHRNLRVWGWWPEVKVVFASGWLCLLVCCAFFFFVRLPLLWVWRV